MVAEKPIPFEVEVLNLGNAMDLNSGTFTTPTAGIYDFSFNGVKHWDAGRTGVYLQLNGKEKIAHGYGTDTSSKGHFTIALSIAQNNYEKETKSTCLLTAEESMNHDDNWHYTGFTGSLVEEDLA